MSDGREGMPLRAIAKGGALRISIGASTLAFAFDNSEDNNPYNDETDTFDRTYIVKRPFVFARDVCYAMNDEAEDGSTPLTRFLDKMMQSAVEQGSDGVEEVKTDKTA